MRRGLGVFAILVVGCALAMCSYCAAQGAGTIGGKVVDITGAAIPDAAVSLSDLTTGKLVHATTGADGQFNFKDVPANPQLVTIEKFGFESFTQRVSLGSQPAITVNATLNVATLADTVVVRGTVLPEAEPVPTRDDVQLIPQTVRVLDRQQLDAAGPVAGGAQMMAATPGANVVGYGETGATKYTVLLNGIQQGWAGEATSFTAPGSLGITYDGVPVADPATGLWQSATVPQNLLMQNLDVTYGPGAADTRWYTDVGGRVEFTPIQPTTGMHASVSATYGQFNQRNIAFVMNTGNIEGWSTVLGGGVGDGDDYRVAPDGFGNNSRDGSAFGKTVRTFSAGSFAFGGYYAKAGGYRPTVIPTTDQGVLEPNGSSFSQATTGFYSSLPFDAYNKYDTNEMAMFYGRQNLLLNETTTLRNMTWFVHIRRFHRRNDDFLASAGAPDQTDEWNNPHSNVFGDQINLTKALPWNALKFGGYLFHEIYNARNLFYSSAQGGDGATETVSPGAKFRSGYFQQDDVSFFAQDDIHPIPQIHITPGVRVVGFSTSYSDQAQRDFNFLPGVIYSTHCSLNPVPPSTNPATGLPETPAEGQQIDPYFDILGTPSLGIGGTATKDQGSLCGAHESRSGVEPSIDVGVTPFQWLTIYGGYDTEYRSPALGGGGGQFQQINPAYYALAKGAYSQFGVKVHFNQAPLLKNFILGVNYFHLDYTNQEIDFETATGVEESGGGNSTYHGVDAFFDDDPLRNLHIFVNFAGEAANFTTYFTGGPVSECSAAPIPSGCTKYGSLPVSYVPKATLNTGFYYGIEHKERVLVEPRFWFQYTGSQYLWSNLTGAPSSQTMPSYTTANLSFTVPVKWFNFRLDVMNLFNSQFNEWEYISSGGYFGTPTGGYINAYPGAPRTVYGTITYQF